MKVKAFGTHNFHSAWKNDLEWFNGNAMV
jgi:hypothetical protein